MRRLKRLRVAGGRVAPTPGNTGLGRIGVDGVVAVEPVHADVVVVPDAQDQDHLLELLAHLGQPPYGGEVVVVPEGRLLLRAELVRDVVDRVDARDGRDGVGDHRAALHVEALDGLEVAGVGARVRDELRHDGEGLGGVDRLGGAVEVLVAHAEGVEVAAVWVKFC